MARDVKNSAEYTRYKQTYFMPEDLEEPSVLTAIDESSLVTVKKEVKTKKPDLRKSQPEK